MRARAALVAGGLAASLLTASVPAQAMTGGPAQVSITKAKAEKLVKAAVLTKKDMTGFTAERSTADPTDAEDQATLYACLGAKVPKYVARNPGFSYSKGVLVLDSSADVVSTVKAARADIKAFGTKKAPGCMKKVFALVLEREGGSIESIKIRKIAVDVAGADIAFGYRYDIVAEIDDVPFRLVGHDLYVLVGQTEIAVAPGRFDGKAPSLAKSEALAEKVVTRVRAV